ncbi:MAG TPA: FlgD immunoglobulin-like domain containing protein [bacterium]|nr:FlgD immunoglobulin-like domain containing protein [bacterium]
MQTLARSLHSAPPLAGIVLLSLLGPGPARSASPCAVHETRQQFIHNVPMQNDMYEVARLGNRLFVASHLTPSQTGGLDIFNVANPLAPYYVGGLRPPEVPSSGCYTIDVSGTLVILGAWSEICIVETASVPPPVLSRTPLPGSARARDLLVSGNLLFAAMDRDGLFILDISDPTAPVVLSNFVPQNNNEVYACAINGSYAYLAVDDGSQGLQILDISDPTAPALLGSSGYRMIEALVDGADLFTIEKQQNWVVRFDLSNPASPQEVDRQFAGWTANRLHVVGNRIYWTGGLIGVPGYGEIGVLDRNAFSAGPIGILRPYGGVDAWFSPPYAFLTSAGLGGGVGLNVVELLSEASVESDIRWYMPDNWAPSQVHDVCGVSGVSVQLDLTYDEQDTMFYSVIRVLDSTVPGQLMTSASTSLPSTVTAKRLDARSDLAVVTSDRGLETASLAPPAFLSYAAISNAEDVALAGDYAYVSRSTGGIDVVDVAMPSTPVVVGSVATAGSALEVMADGGFLYATDSIEGLRIYDLSNPASPSPVATGLFAESLDGLALADGKAYLKGASSGNFHVVDVSNPASPAIEGSASLAVGSSRLLALPGHDRVYAVFDEWSGLASRGALRGYEPVDVSDPSQPASLEQVYFPSVGGYAVAAAEAISLVQGEVVCFAGPYAYAYPLSCSAQSTGAPQAEQPGATIVRAFPNPFSSSTRIRFDVPRAGPATLSVHDTQGRLVREISTGVRSEGRHSAWWDGRDANGHRVASGVYFLRLETGGEVQFGRTTRLR